MDGVDRIYSNKRYVYTYMCHEDEKPLCDMELRTLSDSFPSDGFVLSQLKLDPSRSPFVKHRLDVWFEAEELKGIEEKLQMVDLEGQTFKVVYVNMKQDEASYDQKRSIEKQLGFRLKGKAEMKQPDLQFGIIYTQGVWRFGPLLDQKAIWLRHQKKPHNYSMALNTRTARALVNIAAPSTSDITMIDPCCGIGTVLLEALSMDIAIVGFDINPLAVVGTRKNLTHFGFPDVVRINNIADITGKFDALILDMPYNLYSKISSEEQRKLLVHARRLTRRAVVVSMEPLSAVLEEMGFVVLDHCELRKGRFIRQIYVCI
jgi:tRNA G10  N-methylase Trm11